MAARWRQHLQETGPPSREEGQRAKGQRANQKSLFPFKSISRSPTHLLLFTFHHWATLQPSKETGQMCILTGHIATPNILKGLLGKKGGREGRREERRKKVKRDRRRREGERRKKVFWVGSQSICHSNKEDRQDICPCAAGTVLGKTDNKRLYYR